MVRVLAPGAAEAPPEIAPHVTMDDEVVEFAKVEPAGGEGANLWYRVELARADRRAAVRALFESRDIKVSRMTQVAFGDIQLPRDLPRMRHRALARDQLEKLYALAQLPAPMAAEPAPQRGARKKVAQHRRPSREHGPPGRKESVSTKKSPRRGAPQGRRRKGR
jgi:23S rRNA pseudouridine2605 synthase